MILLLAYGPFNGYKENPALTVASRVSERRDNTTYREVAVSMKALRETIDKISRKEYSMFLGIGVAKRQYISLERIAVNFIHANIPDTDGIVHVHRKIEPSGPLALETTIPVVEIEKELGEKFPVKVSYNAGTYLCNAMLYLLLYNFPDVPVGFIHVVPFNKIQLDKQVKTVSAIIDFLSKK